MLDGTNTIAFTTCTTDASLLENWIVLPRIETTEAGRLHISIIYSLKRCYQVPDVGRHCKEAISLYEVLPPSQKNCQDIANVNFKKFDAPFAY